jgi:predicted porin
VRHGVLIGAFALVAAVAALPALAEDASSPATAPGGGPVLVIGAPDSPAAVADDNGSAGGGPWLLGLGRYLSQTRFTVGATPAEPLGGPGSAANTYAEVGLGGLSLGGRFTHWLETDPQHPDDRSYSLGASYSLDSWTLGLDWTHGNYDESFLDIGDRNDTDVYAFTTSYSLRPGVRINGLLEYSDSKSGQAGADSGSLAVGIGTLINF